MIELRPSSITDKLPNGASFDTLRKLDVYATNAVMNHVSRENLRVSEQGRKAYWTILFYGEPGLRDFYEGFFVSRFTEYKGVSEK